MQAARLLRESELGGTARLLAASAPGLARAGHASLELFPQVGSFSRCVSENLVPAGNVQIDSAGGYPFATGQPNIREFFYGVAQLAGESQGFDGNGPFVRFQAGGGPQLVQMPNPLGGEPAGPTIPNTALFAQQHRRADRHPPPAPGVDPARVVTPPPFRMDVPCHTQALPEINGAAAALGPPSPEAVP